MHDKLATLNEAVDTLHPFEAVTTKMSSEKYLSASKIIPLSKSLLMITSQKTNELSTKLFYHMKARFLNVEGNQLLASSTILDPRFKKFAFSDQNAAEKIARAIVAQCSSLNNSGNDPGSNVKNSGEVSVNPLWRFFDQRVAEVRAARRPATDAFIELQQFCTRMLAF